MFGASAKDKDFFSAFSTHAKLSVEAAGKLVELFEDLGKADELTEAIRRLEGQGDTVTHETMKRLHETWITPLDRHDIYEMITSLDDVLDMIEAASERVQIFGVKETRPHAKELAEVLLKSCDALAKATALLPTVSKSAKEILEISVEINRLENVADGHYRKALGELFSTPTKGDPAAHVLDVMKWRDIFDYLENATDACEDVANVIEGIVLEYA